MLTKTRIAAMSMWCVAAGLLLGMGFHGERFDNFKLRDLDNQQIELAALLKSGPVLVDFWATWCKPCLKAFPELEKLHEKYREKGLHVLGINEDEQQQAARIKSFVNDLKVNFTILRDPDNDLMRKTGVQALPTTLLIDRDGTIVWRHVGYSLKSLRELETRITGLLNPRRETGTP